MRKIQPVIMCGGSGTRVWPESRETLPKQFIPLVGERSTFQTTMQMLADPAFETPIIISNKDYRFLLADQLLPDARHLHRRIARLFHQARAHRVGFVFQAFNLLPRLTIEENVALPLELGGVSTSEARSRAAEMLDRVLDGGLDLGAEGRRR